MQDGDVLHLAKTEQEAKREIDSILLERPHEVVFSGLTHTFQWLSDAVKFAVRTGGTLQDLFTNQFNAI